jgi:hypothetical protein
MIFLKYINRGEDMKKFIIVVFTVFVFSVLFAQSKSGDIPVKTLPPEVKQVLDEYIAILNSPDLDECAKKFITIAGGHLVNEEGDNLDRDIKPYSLKKDFNNIKFYQQPVKITRVNFRDSDNDGYGKSAIKGKSYKIWIKKKEGTAGMPAPILIMVPEGHEEIKTPKIIGIGSL